MFIEFEVILPNLNLEKKTTDRFQQSHALSRATRGSYEWRIRK